MRSEEATITELNTTAVFVSTSLFGASIFGTPLLSSEFNVCICVSDVPERHPEIRSAHKTE
ncbi:hypothetical protein SOASR032_08380 [Pragia fontium]|uniref:Uncharacterized protein n=1 Tax=Pragia fontium TaxID=82985 RepID=A0ABQ5LFZ8_9GAMM|nr:hypothetical protein SOASR032_08380 [Pragia fontium]